MGIVSIQRFSEYAVLGVWQITESIEELLLNLRLTELEGVLLNKKSTDAKKKEWLACRNLLHLIENEPLEIYYDENGKPFLSDNRYNISMSHSSNYAALYLNQKNFAGVDIQKLKPSISAGAGFFLNDDELIWVDIHDNLKMHLLWSAKESAFKYVGMNDLHFKKDIKLKPFDSNQNNLITVTILSQGVTTNIQISYLFFEQYVLTWTI